MRYIVQFFDRSTKRVPPEAAREFMKAMNDGGNVLYRGQMFSGKSIASIKTVFGWYQDKLQSAKENRGYFCKYGHIHDSRLDCGCKDARLEPVLTKDEIALLPEWTEKREQEQALLLFPRKDDRMPSLLR